MTAEASLLILGATLVAAAGLLSAAFLKAWSGWLELRRVQLGGGTAAPQLRALKDRVRRLEALASGEA
jgi:hypothetical protein